jgi:hypothetical protein
MEKKKEPDLRRRDREPTTIPVGVVSKVGEEKTDAEASAMNISLSGARVRTRLELVPKQPVQIVIEGQFTQSIPGRVVWVKKDQSSPWTEAGIKFAA